MDFSNFSSSDWQSFSYSSLLLVLLLSGLLSRKDISVAKILKYLALWSLVAASLVLIYSYRYEFSDLKNRFLKTPIRDNPDPTLAL
ncbi:MAG: hypothetical protein EBS06_07595 [Proteobacteria bacterium]|nr:hypothetical protein [Pseudomonadota bacterium]